MRATISPPSRLGRALTRVGTAGLLGIVGMAGMIGLAGCADSPDPSGAAATAGTSSTTSAGPSSGISSTATSPAPPPQSETTARPCPYLEQGYVEGTVGQQVGVVEVTTVEPPSAPLPTCTFRALNDEPAVVVSTEQHPSPVEAMNAALAKVGTAGNPVTDVGDGGAVLAANGQTICAVAKDTAVVVVTLNQESSLEGEEIVGAVAELIP